MQQSSAWDLAFKEAKTFESRLQGTPEEQRGRIALKEIAKQLIILNGTVEELVHAVHRLADKTCE